MTSNLKCPFCQKRLSQGYNHDRDTVIYHCNNCYFQGDGIIWIALIQAKQDLEIARKALDLVANGRGDGQAIMREYEKGKFIGVREICRKALKQIEHKE